MAIQNTDSDFIKIFESSEYVAFSKKINTHMKQTQGFQIRKKLN